MSQHDYVIDNGNGAAVRADINAALAAIVTQNSGGTAPTTTYAGMGWWDTANNLIKIRNGANTAWVTAASFDGTTFRPYSGGVALTIGATVQPYDAATAKTDAAQTFTAPQGASSVEWSGATSTGTVTIDLDDANNQHSPTLTGAITLANPSNMANAAGRDQKGTIYITTGGFDFTAFGTYWKRIGGATAADISMASETYVRLDYHVVSATRIEFTYNPVEA